MPITAIQVAIEEKPLMQINYNHETNEPQVYNPKYSNDEKETQQKDTLKNVIFNLKNKTTSFSKKIINITDVYYSLKLISLNCYNKFFTLPFKKYKFYFIKLIQVVIEITKEERLPQVLQRELTSNNVAITSAYCTTIQFQEDFYQKTITPQVFQIQEEVVSQIQEEDFKQIQEEHAFHSQKMENPHIQKEISCHLNSMESQIKKGIFII